MKITIYELLGMIKDGKANDITTDFIFDGEKYNLSKFLDTYALDINSLNWKIEILEEEKKIPEKLKILNANEYSKELYYENYSKEEIALDIETLQHWVNEIIDYLKSKGE